MWIEDLLSFTKTLFSYRKGFQALKPLSSAPCYRAKLHQHHQTVTLAHQASLSQA